MAVSIAATSILQGRLVKIDCDGFDFPSILNPIQVADIELLSPFPLFELGQVCSKLSGINIHALDVLALVAQFSQSFRQLHLGLERKEKGA